MSMYNRGYAILIFLGFLGTMSLKCTVAVIGTGYVGLVTGTGLAAQNNTVICVDIDQNKINNLNDGLVPFYEPGLKELIDSARAQSLLHFTTDIGQAVDQADIVIIAVGTPSSATGEADLSALFSATKMVGKALTHPTVICIKSTVPVGTCKKIRHLLEEQGVSNHLFSIVSNPEFLREGSAVEDFFNPHRIVIGTEDQWALQSMKALYQPFIDQQIPFITTTLATSELIKYASNAFLATKISFINEMANLCDAVEADVTIIAHAMGLDTRIGSAFLSAGPGFGGSCFPKDSQALLHTGLSAHVPLHVVKASLIANEIQKKVPFYKLQQLLKEKLPHSTIAVLGLAFKAHTDDVRYSCAIDLLEELQKAGASIRAYDPVANNSMRLLFPSITYCTNEYETVENADAVVIMTDWPQFKELSLAHIKKIMKTPIIIDCRAIFDIKQLQHHEFSYATIGRGSSLRGTAR